MAAFLPIIVGVMAIAITLTLVGWVATFFPMSIFVLNMISMIGLGVGIDYSLLVITRFREELNAGLRPREAAARTFSTAGHAVMVSGMTVVVGFGALLLTPLTETRSVGIAGLLVVAVAVLLATTLLPALLSLLGRNIDRPRWLARRLAWYHRPQIWERWARSLSRHPYRALVIGGTIIALLTLPALKLRIGLPSRHWWPERDRGRRRRGHARADGDVGVHPAGARADRVPRRERWHRRHRPPRPQGTLRFAARRPART